MQTQPVEDIDAVLGRFLAWTGSRNAAEAKPGIRELSCEEALQSRRYRWKAGGEASAKKKQGAQPGLTPVAVPAATSKQEPVRQKTAPVKARNTKQGTAQRVHSRERAAKAVPVARSAAADKAERKPEFREVLAEAIRPTEVMVAAQPVELARQVAISIRLAPAERALIKTRAAEAGITASAYIRQCALEVEQLRAQVQQTLAAMERKAPASIPAPAALPGLFARIVRRFFPGTAQVLALRA
jgi:Mobilization protein NikA